MCSCKNIETCEPCPPGRAAGVIGVPHGTFEPTPPALPPESWTGKDIPREEPWRPPGIAGPWPLNEYVCDGGDRDVQVTVRKNFDVHGLDQEDTVGHFETLDGRMEVQASNAVCLYAPRFAAARKVTGLELYRKRVKIAGVEQPLEIVQGDGTQSPTTMLQPVQPEQKIGARTLNIFRERNPGGAIENWQRVARVDLDDLLPFEESTRVRRGVYNASEKLRLANSLSAAVTWSHDQAVQVVLDGQLAHETSNEVGVRENYVYQMPEGKSRLRVVKLASTDHALPGDVIDFTIRFDNVGDQLIGNVTIIDNLSSRLAYVPDSAQCSVGADFFPIENDGESLILRWEIHQPLEVNDGGIIRFQCKMR